MKTIMKMLAYVGLPILLLWYGIGAHYRSSAGSCERETNGAYIGELCYVALRGGTVFRVYDAKSGEKLAERFFFNELENRLVWGRDRVYYNSGTGEIDEPSIPLPPTRLDHLRARLP